MNSAPSKKTVLITGGTGYLGRHLARKMLPEWRVILGARNNKQNFIAGQITGAETTPLDITSMESVRDAVVEFRPDVIIHAAATKFVDLSEKMPMECVDVNVTGSQNVARVAVDKGVPIVIGISTDKAAPPVRNTYGLSKALMERLFCSMDGKTATRFACVRYGNVSWSTGSVLPIWKKMSQQTGVLGTTGPEMRRFFFTVDEAAELVLTALREIDTMGGKVLSREMKAAQIQEILDVAIELWGGRWERIEGRPGERIDEFLIGDLELAHTRRLHFGGVAHYLISFNEKAADPVPEIVSSGNAQRLTRDEIRGLLQSEPDIL
ncbi:MAG: SDR family NAD(P)-dependent oxidoreductase [Prosthecobacter sp.]